MTHHVCGVPYYPPEGDPFFLDWDKSGGITITEDQISDLKTYLLSEADPFFGAWNKTDGISIDQSQISNLSIAEGRIPFANAAGELIDDSKLFWDGNLGLGLNTPARMLHMQDRNATFRIDRDTNSPVVQLHRFPSGDWTTPWKGFVFGVNGTGPDEGTFFIKDFHQSVSGSGDERLTIDNDGKIIIPGALDVGSVIAALDGDSGEWNAAYTHKSSNGTDHSFIDQNVSVAASPIFAELGVVGSFIAGKIYVEGSGGDYLGWTAGDNVFEFSGGLMIGGTLFCNDLSGDSITIATADITDLLETPIIRNSDGDTVTIQDYLDVRKDDDKQAMFFDTRAQAKGVGGGIMFGGKYTDAGAEAMAAEIRASKSNSTSGHVGFDMIFETQDSIGTITERAIFTSDGLCGLHAPPFTPPTKPLDVWGDTRIRGNIVADGTVNGFTMSDLAPKASPAFTGDISFPGTSIWKSTGLVGIGTIDPKEELNIKSIHPTIAFEESDGASNEKVWEFGASNEEFWLKTANDLYSGTSTVFKAHGRNGTSVTKFSIPNANVSIGTDIVGNSPLKVVGLDLYTSNEDAIAGGLTVGEFFRNGAGTDKVCVVH